MVETLFSNPIAWAHLRARGGWKNHLFGAAGYALLILVVIAFSVHLSPGKGTFAGWSSGMLGLQMAVLGFYGCTAIGNSIRRDITAGLIESHRLMPISSPSAVVGYLIGPGHQALQLAAVNVAIGTFCAAMAGVSMDQWALANLILLLFVAFLWVTVAFASFVAKNAFGAIFAVLMGTFTGGGIMLTFIPALAVMMTPLMGRSLLIGIGGGGGPRLTPGYGYGFGAQLVIGAILFRGACRRYRRDDVPALGALLSFFLLGAWVLTSIVGVIHWDDVRPVFLRGSDTNVTAQSVAAVVSAMLVALVTVWASARVTTDWARTRATTGRTPPGRRPAPPPLLAALAAAMIFPLAIAAQPDLTPAMRHGPLSRDGVLFAAIVSAVALTFLLSMDYLLRALMRAGRKPVLPLLLWVIITWLMPFGIDAMRPDLPNNHAPPPLYSLASPVGDLIGLWNGQAEARTVGLVTQFAYALVAALLWWATSPRRQLEAVLPSKG